MATYELWTKIREAENKDTATHIDTFVHPAKNTFLDKGHSSIIYGRKRYYFTKTETGGAPLEYKDIKYVWALIKEEPYISTGYANSTPFCRDITNTPLGKKVLKYVFETEQESNERHIKDRIIKELRDQYRR